MGTWKRIPNNFNTDGSHGTASPTTLTGTPYCYYTDQSIIYSDVFYPPNIPGTHVYESQWVRQNGPPPYGNRATRTSFIITDLGNGNYRHEVYGQIGTTTNVGSQPMVLKDYGEYPSTTQPVLFLEHGLDPFDDNQISWAPGNLDLEISRVENTAGYYDVTLTTPTGTINVGTLEYRAFVLKNFLWSQATIDPNIPEHIPMTGELYALPPGSSWVPEVPLEYRVEIVDLSSPTVPVRDDVTSMGHVSGTWPKQSSAFMIGFSGGVWNGVINGSPVPGNYRQRASIIPEIESGHHTFTRVTSDTVTVLPLETCPPTEDEKRKREDPTVCYTLGTVNDKGQIVSRSFLYSGWSSSLDTDLSVGYMSANASKAPSSMGYGWGLNREERLSLSTSQDKIVYTYNSGQFEVWDIVNGDYVPAFPQNFTTLEEDQNDSSFLMTFQDKSTKRFYPLSSQQPGAIEWERDKNGNTLYFHYDNDRLKAVSDTVTLTGDPDGRIIRLEYPNSSEKQPTVIWKEKRDGATVLGQRQTTLTYYPSTDSGQGFIQSRLANMENSGGESQTFLYYADNQDYRFGKLHKVLDPRGHTVVEYDYHADADIRVKKETVYYKDENDLVVPEMTREFTYGTDQITTLITDLTGKSAAPVRQTVFSYNSSGQLVSREDTIGSTTNLTEYRYTDSNNPYKVTRVIDPKLEYEDRTYNSRGNILTIDNKNREVTTLTYSTGDLDLLEKITSPAVTVPDPDNPGQTITEQYETVFGYDANKNLTSVTQTTGPVGANQTATTYFRIRNGVDHPATDGKVWKVVDRRWDGNPTTEDNFAVVFDYYPNGNLESIQTPSGPGPHPVGKSPLNTITSTTSPK